MGRLCCVTNSECKDDVLTPISYDVDTPNKYPISAVNSMANVPQNVILIMAFQILEPPVLAAIAPSRAKNRMESHY